MNYWTINQINHTRIHNISMVNILVIILTILTFMVTFQFCSIDLRNTNSTKQYAGENNKSVWKKFEFNGGLGGVEYTLYNDLTYRFYTWDDIIIIGETPAYFYGKYSVDSNKIKLFALKHFADESPKDANFFIVIWGKLELLVEENEMIDLCNTYNSRLYPPTSDDEYFSHFISYGPTFVHEAGVPHDSLFGKPSLPSPWNNYLLDSPLRATITKIDTINFDVWIDKGTFNGVFMGCKLYTSCKSDVTVVDISTTESKCKPKEDLDFIQSIAKHVANDQITDVHWLQLSMLRNNLNYLHENFKCLKISMMVSTTISDIENKRSIKK